MGNLTSSEILKKFEEEENKIDEQYIPFETLFDMFLSQHPDNTYRDLAHYFHQNKFYDLDYYKRIQLGGYDLPKYEKGTDVNAFIDCVEIASNMDEKCNGYKRDRVELTILAGGKYFLREDLENFLPFSQFINIELYNTPHTEAGYSDNQEKHLVNGAVFLNHKQNKIIPNDQSQNTNQQAELDQAKRRISELEQIVDGINNGSFTEIEIEIEEPFKSALEYLSKEENITVSEYIAKVARQSLEKKGLLPTKEDQANATIAELQKQLAEAKQDAHKPADDEVTNAKSLKSIERIIYALVELSEKDNSSPTSQKMPSLNAHITTILDRDGLSVNYQTIGEWLSKANHLSKSSK